MLVPTEEEKLDTRFVGPEGIPGYGARGWCRCEYFIFSLWAEMLNRKVELYAILIDGSLHQYPTVVLWSDYLMPSGGDLSNPADKQIIMELEDQMVEAYGNALVWKLCAAGKDVDLTAYHGKQRVMIVVLRGFLGEVCMYCVAQTGALADARPKLEAANVEVLVIYPGERENEKSFRRLYEEEFGEGPPPYRVFYDPDLELVTKASRQSGR